MSDQSKAVPLSREEWLDRRARLWARVQGADPSREDVEGFLAEWAALTRFIEGQKGAA